MIIDCHAHLVPQSWFHPKSPKSIFDLDGLFKEQDESGVDITVFGNNWIRSPDGAEPLRVVQEFNAARGRVDGQTSEALARSSLLGSLRQRQNPQGNRKGHSRIQAQGHHDRFKHQRRIS